jgi:hypothetical protein
MPSAPYVLTNFKQIRNVSIDFFSAKVRNIKIPMEIRDRCGNTGKRMDTTKLTGALFRYFAFSRQMNISSVTNFMKIRPAVLQFVTRGRTDGRTRTANCCNSSSGTLRNISRRGYYSVLFCRYRNRRIGSMVSHT